MRPRAPSLLEALFPDSPEFDAIAEHWPKDVVDEILGLVWDGFEQMKARHLHRADFTVDYEQLERGLTSLHIREILLLWDSFSSFIPIPEACEWRKRASRSSKPLAVDIAFESVANPSVHFAVEAKVLEHPGDVDRYLKDLNDKYLSGQASPLSGTAALAGYLRSGLADEVFPHLEKKLGQKPAVYAPFANRPHRTSRHQRSVGGTGEPTDFTCHHLILSLSN